MKKKFALSILFLIISNEAWNQIQKINVKENKMDKDDKKEFGNHATLPLPSSSDLRGRQSVRATFKLSEKAIDAIAIVATHLGIKQKSLFDHLIDDIRSLNLIAREIQQDSFSRLNRIQKTYVLSRRTLSSLETASKKYDAPRDALVEYSIQRLLPVIAEERKKHRKRKEILVDITEYLKQGEKILSKSKELLGEDDPVYDRFETVMAICQNAQSSIKAFVEKGEIIEDY
jgi:hypothetical protein